MILDTLTRTLVASYNIEGGGIQALFLVFEELGKEVRHSDRENSMLRMIRWDASCRDKKLEHLPQASSRNVGTRVETQAILY